MKRDAGGVEQPRPAHVAGFHLERVVRAVAVGVEPLANGIARELRIRFLGPIAPVGKDASDRAHGLQQHVGGLGPDHDFHRLVEDHHPRHADRPASALDVENCAGFAFGEIRLEHLLVFGRERRLLAETARLGRIPHPHRTAALPQPLPIGILLGVLGVGAGDRKAQCPFRNFLNRVSRLDSKEEA